MGKMNLICHFSVITNDYFLTIKFKYYKTGHKTILLNVLLLNTLKY